MSSNQGLISELSPTELSLFRGCLGRQSLPRVALTDTFRHICIPVSFCIYTLKVISHTDLNMTHKSCQIREAIGEIKTKCNVDLGEDPGAEKEH